MMKLNSLAAGAVRVLALFCLFFTAVNTHFAKSMLQLMGNKGPCLKKVPKPAD